MKNLKPIIIFALTICFQLNLFSKGWEEFEAPKVELIIQAKGHIGIDSYLDLVKQQGYKDIEAWVQHCALMVAQELYYTVEEANAKNVETITYKLNDGGALSYKDGSSPHIEIGFDLNHLMMFIEKHDLNIAAKELYGVLCHEIAHGYQQEPKNAGTYQNDTEFFGFIEGTADLTRLKTGGFHPPRSPKQGGNYKSGYNITAFFYLWITKTKDEDFLKKLNQTAKNMDVWSLKNAINELYNTSVTEWWQHFQQDIELYPWDNYREYTSAAFINEEKILFEGDVLSFKNHSRLADKYEWTINYNKVIANEDGDMAWVFPKKGEYHIQLVAINDQTGARDTISKILTVKSMKDDFEFSYLGINSISQYQDSPKGESTEQLFDNNPNTKFLCFEKKTWVQIEMENPYFLKSYSLISANDQAKRDPKNWTLSASMDGKTFDRIDVQQNIVFETRKQKKEFSVHINKAYKYFRLEMEYHETDDYGKDIIQLAEWILIGHER